MENEFFKKYFTKIQINNNYSNIDTMCGNNYRIQTAEPTVTAEMYLAQLQEIEKILMNHDVEVEVRKSNEAVNKAYEHYLTLLNLAK